MGLFDLFRRRPRLTLDHPELGELIFDSMGQSWSRQRDAAGLSFQLCITGTESGLNPNSLRVWSELEPRLAERVSRAREMLAEIAAGGPFDASAGAFEFETADVLDPEVDWADYVLYFGLESDADGLWRVSSRDDSLFDPARDD